MIIVKRSALCLALLGGLTLGGCTVIPVALTEAEAAKEADYARHALGANQEPLTGAIDLSEATARAIKYNLDFRLELMEKSLAQRQLDLASYDALPRLIGEVGYDGRNNFSGATSRSLLTGQPSLESSTSSDRDIFSANLGLSWNVLDFGLSYVRAHQAADRVLVAEEQKRKVVNRIVQDTRSAYWRAVSAERLMKRLHSLKNRVSGALWNSKAIVRKKLNSPLTALTYQRELLSTQRDLQELQRTLGVAKVQLSALMNIKPGTPYQLVVPSRDAPVTTLNMSGDEMERLALQFRPEIREVAYRKRINAQELRVAMLELLPGINFNVGANANSNSFLFENDWLTYGARATWNLLNVFKLPAKRRVIDGQQATLEARQAALAMAILTQVNVGVARYAHSKEEYATAKDYRDTQRSILEQIQHSFNVERASEQTLIREQMNALVSEVRYDIAHADVENAHANVGAAIGRDPLPNFDVNRSVSRLSEDLRKHWSKQR